MPEYVIDPELQREIPPLTDSEYAGLEEDISTAGRVHQPLNVWQHEGQTVIVDGHNRFEIAKKYGLPLPEPIYMEFADKTEAKVWINRQQLNRRNLTDGLKLDCCERIRELLREQGRRRKVEEGKQTGRGHKKVLSNNDKTLPYQSCLA